jgi:hypothetical protein
LFGDPGTGVAVERKSGLAEYQGRGKRGSIAVWGAEGSQDQRTPGAVEPRPVGVLDDHGGLIRDAVEVRDAHDRGMHEIAE